LKKKKLIINILLILLFTIIIGISYLIKFKTGIQIGNNTLKFSKSMFIMIPGIFILIGLFEVWVKRETVVKHLGKESGIRGYFIVMVLSGFTMGGLYVAFPVAYTLYNKGAKLSVVFTFIGAFSICRIPMTIFEASYMGIKFTIIRYVVSLPLIMISSMLLGKYLEKRNYKVMEGK